MSARFRLYPAENPPPAGGLVVSAAMMDKTVGYPPNVAVVRRPVL